MNTDPTSAVSFSRHPTPAAVYNCAVDQLLCDAVGKNEILVLNNDDFGGAEEETEKAAEILKNAI
ncbi:MAG TPA: hypothetical protein VFE24_14990 [Pirellulales bacterium]|jgi:hypothetical protein|nr:hypothetical protein [Pirellulales bacterium]